MNIIPAVDVLDGNVVRLMHGDFDRVTVYDPHPAATAKRWMEEGASIVHVVDLAGARDGTANPDLWAELADVGVVFQVGGGIRDAATAQNAIDSGADKVVLGSAIVNHPERLGEIVSAVGGAQVVAAIDVRGGMALGSGWEDKGIALDTALQRILTAEIGSVLVTGIETDGTMEGPNHSLFEDVQSRLPSVSFIASGGVGSLTDITALRALACSAAIVGRALYEDRFTLAEARVAGG